MASTKQPEVVQITGARVSLTEDMRRRQRRYLWSMGVRTVAFVAAVGLLHGWARWTGVVLAVTLPWFAVVVANIGRPTGGAVPGPVEQPGRRALTAEPTVVAPVTVVGAVRVPGPAEQVGHSDIPPTAPGPDHPVDLPTTRGN